MEVRDRGRRREVVLSCLAKATSQALRASWTVYAAWEIETGGERTSAPILHNAASLPTAARHVTAGMRCQTMIGVRSVLIIQELATWNSNDL